MSNKNKANRIKGILFGRVLHGAVMKDLAFAALNPKYPETGLKKVVKCEERGSQDNHWVRKYDLFMS